jgi:hypothetical protein
VVSSTYWYRYRYFWKCNNTNVCTLLFATNYLNNFWSILKYLYFDIYDKSTILYLNQKCTLHYTLEANLWCVLLWCQVFTVEVYTVKKISYPVHWFKVYACSRPILKSLAQLKQLILIHIVFYDSGLFRFSPKNENVSLAILWKA